MALLERSRELDGEPCDNQTGCWSEADLNRRAPSLWRRRISDYGANSSMDAGLRKSSQTQSNATLESG